MDATAYDSLVASSADLLGTCTVSFVGVLVFVFSFLSCNKKKRYVVLFYVHIDIASVGSRDDPTKKRPSGASLLRRPETIQCHTLIPHDEGSSTPLDVTR